MAPVSNRSCLDGGSGLCWPAVLVYGPRLMKCLEPVHVSIEPIMLLKLN